MRIEDPTRVVGSGFIQFPPQRPFQQNVVRQPPTIAQVRNVYERAVSEHPSVHKATRPQMIACAQQREQLPVPVAVNAATCSVNTNEPCKLSKAQARRRRKKLREG